MNRFTALAFYVAVAAFPLAGCDDGVSIVAEEGFPPPKRDAAAPETNGGFCPGSQPFIGPPPAPCPASPPSAGALCAGIFGICGWYHNGCGFITGMCLAGVWRVHSPCIDAGPPDGA